ncbi:MAG: 1-deoxy-D-xylulose-5-phosphate synthase [Cyanobacteria bacterium SZAS-4]|nr:1-deoxy-D-xylulose-5-phosphate synthase [Cyanobacteria bacterium SZAS-4]
MRGAFAKTLTELAAKDSRIYLLTGDLGYMALEPFAEKFPDRFINVGVAEQNMVGIATGLAEAGFIPVVYSIVTFASLRPYEFIRNGPILHQLPVRIAGVGGGVEYGHNGATHYGMEDIGVMRVQPGITVVAPADAGQTKTALEKTYDLPGPVYYRLGKDDRIVVPGLDGKFDLGKTQTIKKGKDVLLLAMGGISYETAKAAELLSKEGIEAEVVIVASVNPAPVEDLKQVLSQYRQAITVEAHYASGGLASLVSEVVAQAGINCKISRCAIEQSPDGETGGQGFLYNKFGLSAEAIATKAKSLLCGVPA